MNSEELEQLAALLTSLNSLNEGKGRLYIGEAVIYDANDQPIAAIDYDESERLVLKRVIEA